MPVEFRKLDDAPCAPLTTEEACKTPGVYVSTTEFTPCRLWVSKYTCLTVFGDGSGERWVGWQDIPEQRIDTLWHRVNEAIVLT